MGAHSFAVQRRRGSVHGVKRLSVYAGLQLSLMPYVLAREWNKFEGWFAKHIAPELQLLSINTGIPAMKAVRIAEKTGGYPDESEALIYLSFDKSINVKRRNARSTTDITDNQDEPASRSDGFNASDASQEDRNQLQAHYANAGIRRWRFGESLALLGMFLLIFCEHLPDTHRAMFVGFAIVLFSLGIWCMDRGNNDGFRHQFANHWRL
jgi:hypothetical protein